MISIEQGETTHQYAAVLIFVTACPATDYQPLYEEDIVLIEASSEEEAAALAVEYAKEQEGSYQNKFQETITNSFKTLVDVQQIHSEISHGSSLYSRHFRSYEAYANFEPLLEGKEL